MDDREFSQIRLIAFENDLLTDSVAHAFRRKARQLQKIQALSHLLHQRRRHLRLHQLLHALGERVQVFRSQRQVHAVIAAEGVDCDRNVRALHALEQKRFAAERPGDRAIALVVPVWGGRLADAVADPGDFQDRIDRRLDSGQLAFAIEQLDEVGESSRAHRNRS